MYELYGRTVIPDGHDNKWHDNLVAIKWSDINTIQVSQKLDTSCGPPSEQTTLPRARVLVSPFLASPLGEVGGGTHAAGVFQKHKERMETWRLQLPTSTAPIPGKSSAAWLESNDFLNIFVVGSAVATPSSAYFSLLTTEREHTESGLSGSDIDIYICVEVPPVCLGVLGDAQEKEKAMLGSGVPYFKEEKVDLCTPNLPWTMTSAMGASSPWTGPRLQHDQVTQRADV